MTGFFLSNRGIIVPPIKRTNEVIESAQDNSTFNSITAEYVEPERDEEDAGENSDEDTGDSSEDDAGDNSEEDAEDSSEEDAGDSSEEHAEYSSEEVKGESVVFLLQGVSCTKTFILTEDIGEDLVSGVSKFEYISEDDLVDLVDQIQLDQDECKCPNCNKIYVHGQQSFVSKAAQQILFGIHQLAKPFLSWAGQPSTCLYLVRRDWEQSGVSWLELE